MRNYVQVIGVIVTDTATLQPVTGAFVETKILADDLKTSLEGVYTPPNFSVDEITYWVELNKNTLTQILTTGVPNGVLNFQFLSRTPPAKTWNSKNPNFLVSRKLDSSPPAIPTKLGKDGEADFSGAEGLLEAIAALPDLARRLILAGRLRDAGIVTYAFQQVIHRNWTVVQAFDYLVNNRIVGTHG